MPDATHLNISDNSDEPILKPKTSSKTKSKLVINVAFIILLVIPLPIIAAEILLYPFPPQIDAFLQCDDILDQMSRIDYRNLKTEIFKTEEKLLSIKRDMNLPNLSYDTFLGYKIAKEMLEEYKTELEANLEHQQKLWKECISQNLQSALIPLETKLQTFIQLIICFTVAAFFIVMLIFASIRNFFKSDSRILFFLCFVFQSVFIVFVGILSVLTSIYYCRIWNLNSEFFLEML